MTEALRKPWNGARMSPELEFKIANLPDSPGCYLMKSEGEIIYVGKAVNLKNRVSQYFHYSAQHTPKVRAMVEKIDDFDIMLVDGELEAFALECNLIKLHMPHYNIKLKDDKAYPYIRIDLNERFPRVELARRQEKDGAKYFGPYQGATVVREVLDVARLVFPIRVCSKKLNPEKKLRPCVHHQVGQCPAPCAGLIDEADYRATIDGVIDFLNGKYTPVLDALKAKMAAAAGEMNYERAALYRDRIRAVEAVMQKQKAISTTPSDQDIIAVLPHDADAMVQLMFVRSGRMIGSERFTLEGAGDEPLGEILTQFMLQYYGPENTPPREILLSATPPEHDVIEQLLTEQHGARTYILTPRRGEKLKLVNMAVKNLKDEAKKLDRKNANSRARTIEALETLPRMLYVTVAAPNEEIYRKACRPKIRDGWERIMKTLDLLPSLDTRTCIRHTLVQNYNLCDPEGYAKLDNRAEPDLIEPKGYVFVGGSRQRLTINEMPDFSTIKDFAVRLGELTGKTLLKEKADSRVCLLGTPEMDLDVRRAWENGYPSSPRMDRLHRKI